jgi:hypothetical protein
MVQYLLVVGPNRGDRCDETNYWGLFELAVIILICVGKKCNIENSIVKKNKNEKQK